MFCYFLYASECTYTQIGFTINNQPRSSAEEAQGGRLNPSLNLVQSFEKLDNIETYHPEVMVYDVKDENGKITGAKNHMNDVIQTALQKIE